MSLLHQTFLLFNFANEKYKSSIALHAKSISILNNSEVLKPTTDVKAVNTTTSYIRVDKTVVVSRAGDVACWPHNEPATLINDLTFNEYITIFAFISFDTNVTRL